MNRLPKPKALEEGPNRRLTDNIEESTVEVKWSDCNIADVVDVAEWKPRQSSSLNAIAKATGPLRGS
jgi:hypothetical protein